MPEKISRKLGAALRGKTRKPFALLFRLYSWDAFFAILLVLAFIARVYRINELSLNHDESWIAMTIKEPLIKDMLFPSYWVQTTPPILLFALRYMAAVFGDGEWILRLIPLASGTLAVLLLYLLAKKITGNKQMAVICASLWGFSRYALRHSQELRQYMPETLSALALVYSMEVMLSAKTETQMKKYFFVFALVSVVSIGFSNVAPFVLPLVFVRIFLHRLANGKSTKPVVSLRSIIAYLVLAISLVIGRTAMLIQESEQWIIDYYDKQMLRPGEWGGILGFFFRGTMNIFKLAPMQSWDAAFWRKSAEIMAALFLLGIAYFIYKKNAKALGIVLVPLMAAFLASIFYLYPFGTRHQTFLVPFLAIGIANGIELILSPYRKHSKSFTAAATVLIAGIFPLAVFAKERLSYYHPVEDVKPVIEWYKQLRKGDDFTAVHFRAAFAYGFYDKPVYKQERAQVINYYIYIPSDLHDWKRDLGEIVDKKLINGRLWLIFALDQRGNREEILRFLEKKKKCEMKKENIETNAAGFLFVCGEV